MSRTRCTSAKLNISSLHLTNVTLFLDGTTPLFIASHDGHSDVVNILLRSGAGVNLTKNVSNENVLFTIHDVFGNDCDLKPVDKNDGDGQDLVCMTVTMTVESSSRYYFSGNQSMCILDTI